MGTALKICTPKSWRERSLSLLCSSQDKDLVI